MGRSRRAGTGSATASPFEEEAASRFRSAGLRMTSARRNVAWALARARRPVNAYGIRTALSDAGRKVDVVTIYRILANMTDLGLVHRIGIADGYIACSAQGHHDDAVQYVYCPTCGSVEEFVLEEPARAVLENPLARSGRKSSAVSVEVVSTCNECGPSPLDEEAPGI